MSRDMWLRNGRRGFRVGILVQFSSGFAVYYTYTLVIMALLRALQLFPASLPSLNVVYLDSTDLTLYACDTSFCRLY